MSLDLNHLHLHVRDLPTAQAFYERWFGFRKHVEHGDLVFLRNEDGFDLALMPDREPADLPSWFHFGFRLTSPDAVRDLHGRMNAAEVTMAKPLYDEEDLVSFTCFDPEGYRVEVYWE